MDLYDGGNSYASKHTSNRGAHLAFHGVDIVWLPMYKVQSLFFLFFTDS